MCHGSFQCHKMLHTIYNDCIWYNWFWTRKKGRKSNKKNLQNTTRTCFAYLERNQWWYSIGNKVIEIQKYFNWIGPVHWNRLHAIIKWIVLGFGGIKMIQRYSIFWVFLFVLKKYCSGNDPKCWVLAVSFGS